MIKFLNEQRPSTSKFEDGFAVLVFITSVIGYSAWMDLRELANAYVCVPRSKSSLHLVDCKI